MFGRQYVIDCCINNYNNAQRKEAYDIYVTDSLRIIAENTAKFAGGSYLKMRYADIIEPENEVVEDDRSAQEIVDDIVSRAGITVVRNQ